MNYREKVLAELKQAHKEEYLVSVYKWENLEAMLVGSVTQVSDTHFKLENVDPDGEWEDEITTIALNEVYQLDSGTPYLTRLTNVLAHADKLSTPLTTPKFRSSEKIRSALIHACEHKDVARVSLKSDGRQDVLVYEVGDDYCEFAMIYESGEVESGSNIVPIRFIKWAQIGSRSQEIVQFNLKS